jgi:DNA modification methylase
VQYHTIINGDSLEELKVLSDHSVDLICTDPPYGYGFMGKDWDKAVPSIELWKECFRVLKPGAFVFIMSAPRQDVLSQMIVRVGRAGFDTDFTSIYWTYASGFPKAMNIGKMLDKRASKPQRHAAKALDGSYAGFQPKPAVEVIIVAMKPRSEKTFVDQALKNGHGVTWLDDCRLPTAERLSAFVQPSGRFPGNLLSDADVLGDHSRYFNLDAWAEKLPPEAKEVFPFMVVPKASKREKNAGLSKFKARKTNDGRAKEIDNAFQRGSTKRQNSHPTVKPVKLMQYLITLGSRVGDVVLDPFSGSGTTGIAAKLLGRSYIGIELALEYCQIAVGRIAAHKTDDALF